MQCIFDFIQKLPSSFYEGQIQINLDDPQLESNRMNLVLRIPARNDIFSSSYQTTLIEFDTFFEVQFIYLYCSFYEQYQIIKKISDDKILEACKISLRDLYDLLKKYKKEGDIENEKMIQSEITNILNQNKTIHQSREIFGKFNKEVLLYKNTIYEKLQIIYQLYRKKIENRLKPILSFEVYERTILELMKDFSKKMMEYFEEYLLGIRERKSFWCNCSKCFKEKSENKVYMNERMISLQKELETMYSLFSLYHSALFLEDS